MAEVCMNYAREKLRMGVLALALVQSAVYRIG